MTRIPWPGVAAGSRLTHPARGHIGSGSEACSCQWIARRPAKADPGFPRPPMARAAYNLDVLRRRILPKTAEVIVLPQILTVRVQMSICSPVRAAGPQSRSSLAVRWRVERRGPIQRAPQRPEIESGSTIRSLRIKTRDFDCEASLTRGTCRGGFARRCVIRRASASSHA